MQYYKSTGKKADNPIKTGLNNQLSNVQKPTFKMVNTHMKRCHTPLVIKEMCIKTTKYIHQDGCNEKEEKYQMLARI